MTEPPTNIRALQSESILELTWDDGTVARLPFKTVRSECPCAVCVNEWTGQRVLDPASIRPDIKPEGLEAVGHYAIRIVWNDGHGSGHFTWEKLRELSRGVPSGGDRPPSK